MTVCGHHISPVINDPAQKLDTRAVALEPRIVALGNHRPRAEPTRREHGHDIGLGEKGEDGIRLNSADRSPHPCGNPHQLEAKGKRTRQ